MVRGSRFIPALFGEVEINSVRQMEHAEENTHDSISHIGRMKLIGHPHSKESASSDHKPPSKQSHPPLHKKTGRMKCASIQNHPTQRQPEHSQYITRIPRCGRHIEENHCPNNHSRCESRKHRLSYPACRWRPKRLSSFECLPSHEQERPSHRNRRHTRPKQDKATRRIDLAAPSHDGCGTSNGSVEDHNRRQSSPIQRRTLH